ncbi:MAG: hypothetical protein QJR09_04230 [Micrococcus sp.]|nr:hypothetical protein [Micrococcus sp.]
MSITGTYILGVTFTDYLPAELGDTGSMDTHAQALQDHGKTLTDTWSDARSAYNGVKPHVDFPGVEDFELAFENNTQATKETLAEGLERIGQAVKDFSSAVSGFSSQHANLKSATEAFNDLHPYYYSEYDRTVAAEQGIVLPTASECRSSGKRSDLTRSLRHGKDRYQGIIDDCVRAIKDSSPASMPVDKPFALERVEALMGAYDTTLAWVGRAAYIQDHNGRLGFLWEFDQASVSTFVQNGVPGWTKVHDKDSWLGAVLPDRIKDRIPNVENLGDANFAKNLDQKYAGFLDGMQTRGKVYWARFLDELPPGAQDWLVSSTTRTSDFFHSNFVLNESTGKYVAATTLMTGKKLPSLPQSLVRKIDDLNLDDKLKALENSKFGNVMKHGGKALGVADAGLNYYGAYTEGYNEALADNPHASEDELRSEGVKTALVEGTFETGGSIVGGVVGRTAGAAVGQALIPIPGVGAAIGGFVGGMAGEAVGGWAGKHVGDFANEVRKEGLGGAIKGLFGG